MKNPQRNYGRRKIEQRFKLEKGLLTICIQMVEILLFKGSVIKVVSTSMDPTIRKGQVVLTNSPYYWLIKKLGLFNELMSLKRGDIITFSSLHELIQTRDNRLGDFCTAGQLDHHQYNSVSPSGFNKPPTLSFVKK